MFLHLCILTTSLAISEPTPPKIEAVSEKRQPIALFSPPAGWQCAKPRNLSQHVQVGFIGKGSTQFHPSINLATEEIEVSLKEYVKDVKEIHLSDKNTTWRDLGSFAMKGGVGRLTEITSPSAWGEVKMLQAILVQGKMAYILTAAVLKKEYPNFQKEILESLQSLSLQPDLFAIVDEQKKSEIAQIFASLGNASDAPEIKWKHLQKIIAEQYQEMGSHWQFLALQEGHSKIFSKENR